MEVIENFQSTAAGGIPVQDNYDQESNKFEQNVQGKIKLRTKLTPALENKLLYGDTPTIRC